MVARLDWYEFHRDLITGSMGSARLAEYVEVDGEASTVKLKFRRNVLRSAPPSSYDVDKAIYGYYRDKRKPKPKRGSLITVVAEGDSWFDLPEFLGRRAIADQLERSRKYRTLNNAQWGRTLKRIFERRHYAPLVAIEKPHYFIFSAGGNDLQIELAKGRLIREYSAGHPFEDYLTASGLRLLKRISDSYAAIFEEALQASPSTHIICHGYDYPKPRHRKANYIGRHLRDLNVPPRHMSAVINPVIDKFNDTVENVAARFPNRVTYLNLRDSVQDDAWTDDMHPSNEGFKKLVTKFKRAMA